MAAETLSSRYENDAGMILKLALELEQMLRIRVRPRSGADENQVSSEEQRAFLTERRVSDLESCR
jgi:hypothetical protein